MVESSAICCPGCGVRLNQVVKVAKQEIEIKKAKLQEELMVDPVISTMKSKAETAPTLASYWWWLAWLGVLSLPG